MQNVGNCSLLKRLSNNILFTIFDFLCTETVFLSLALLNKDFRHKTRDYTKLSHTLQIKDTNFQSSPPFPKVENMILRFTNHQNPIEIHFQQSLQNLQIYGSINNNIHFSNTPQSLRYYKAAYAPPIYNTSLSVTFLYRPSLLLGSLKTLTLGQCLSRPQEIDFLNQCTQLEELCMPFDCNIDEKLACAILNHRGLTKLKCGRYPNSLDGGASISDLHMEGFYHFSSLKNLVELGVGCAVLELKEGLIAVLGSLPNLTCLKFIGYANSTSAGLIFFAENSNMIGLKKFKASFGSKYNWKIISPEEISNKLCQFLEIFLNKCINLEVINLVVQGLKPELLQILIPYIINQCKEHPSLYKFNGLPIKALESGNASSITLYENLLLSAVPFGNAVAADITLGILHYYRNSIENLYEIRIRPDKSAQINVYLPKLLNKIQEIGYFSDLVSHFHFPLFSFLTIVAAIRRKSEFKCLRLQTIHTSEWFLETLRECDYLEKFEGPYTEKYHEIFINLPKFNHLSIEKIVSGRELMIQNLIKVTIKNTMFTKSQNLIQYIPLGIQELYLENIEFVDPASVVLFDETFHNFINLRKLVIFASFRDKYSAKHLISIIGNVSELESLYISLTFPAKNVMDHRDIESAMKSSLPSLKKLREFSFIVQIGEIEALDIYYELMIEYKNANNNLEKLYGISPSDFSQEFFRSKFV